MLIILIQIDFNLCKLKFIKMEDYDFGKKKKKPKKSKESLGNENTLAKNSECTDSQSQQKIEGYDYEFMLGRIYEKLTVARPQTRTTIAPPKITMEGSRKTIWNNFADICGMLNRNTAHVLKYISEELATSCSISGQKLVVRGKFRPKQIESIIVKYIGEYVKCSSCRSPNTVFIRENRSSFLHCNDCQAQKMIKNL